MSHKKSQLCCRANVYTQVPDGGWGWVVAVSFFFVEVFTYGIIKSFGVFFSDLMDSFSESNSRISWVVSICVFVLTFTAPVSTVLSSRFGHRLVVMLGGLLVSAGMVTAAFSQKVYHMYIAIGVVSGLGFCFSFLPTVTILSQYFDKRRSVVTAVASTGECFAMFAFAPGHLSCCAGSSRPRWLCRARAALELRFEGFSLQWLFLLWSSGSEALSLQESQLVGSAVMAHGLKSLLGGWGLPGAGTQLGSPAVAGDSLSWSHRRSPSRAVTVPLAPHLQLSAFCSPRPESPSDLGFFSASPPAPCSHHGPEGDRRLEVQHALRGAPATQPRGLWRAAQTDRHRRHTGDPQDPRPRAPEGSAVHVREREDPHLHRLHRLRSRAHYLTEERAWPLGRGGGARGRGAGPRLARRPAAGLLCADREEFHLLHALRALRDAGLLRPVPVHHPAGAQPRPGPRPRGPAALRHGRGGGVRPHRGGAGPQPGAHPQGLHRARLRRPAGPVPAHLHVRHGLLGPPGLQRLLGGHDRDRGGHPHPAARRGRRRGHPEDVVGRRSLRLLPEHLGAGRTPPCRSAGGPEQDLQQSLLLLRGRDGGGRRVPRPRETLQAGAVPPAPSPGGHGPGSPRESVAGHPRRLSGDGPGKDGAQSPCGDGARLTPASGASGAGEDLRWGPAAGRGTTRPLSECTSKGMYA